MKKILFLFLAACFFFSCEKETIVIPQQHAGRTVLAFFWADNSLNSSLRDNIQTMMQGLQAMKDSAALLVSIRPRACFSPSYNKVKSQTKHVWLLTLL